MDERIEETGEVVWPATRAAGIERRVAYRLLTLGDVYPRDAPTGDYGLYHDGARGGFTMPAVALSIRSACRQRFSV